MKNSTCFLNLGAFLALKASTAPAEKVAVAVGSFFLKDLEAQSCCILDKEKVREKCQEACTDEQDAPG